MYNNDLLNHLANAVGGFPFMTFIKKVVECSILKPLFLGNFK